MSAPLLQLHDISKSFGAVRALQGVSLDVRRGEVHALLGENGAGKSTLIKVITGAHQPDAGLIEVAGRPVRHLTPASAHQLGIACIYQQPSLFPDLTVTENIALRLEPGGSLRRVRWADRHRRAAELLTRIGAAFDPATEVRNLSMPEQQLVEIACAVGAGARIVIMDEPTASLTQKEQHILFSLVGELRQSGAGIIYISHRMDEIFTLADRVTVLRDGHNVGTNNVQAINETSLIRMMIGREVTDIYPPQEGSAGRAVLSLCNVDARAGGVRSINLHVRAGEIVGLAGLVGAGRTELARVIFGITPADDGEIKLDDEPVQIRSPQQAVELGIAYVPEDRLRHGIILEMAVASNITMAIHRRIFPRSWLRHGAERRLAAEYITNLEIKTAGPDAPAASLSGGNQQKVALARWLATQPRLLILDEPTQGVDVGAKAEIHRIIRRSTREGMAVLMISSDLPEVLGMSDRIIVMRAGRIVAEFAGKPDPHEVMSAALGHSGHDNGVS